MFNLFNKGCCGQPMNQGCMEREIVEPTINKCIEKEFYHEVPQVWCKSDNI